MNLPIPQAPGVWLSSEQVAEKLRKTARWVRRDLLSRAKSSGDPARFARLVPSNGGDRWEFNLALLDEETQRKFLASSPASKQEPAALAVRTPSPEIINRLLPLDTLNEAAQSSAIAQRKLPWALARRRIIEPLIPNNEGECPWESWHGQTVHGVPIHTKEDFVRALALDSKCAQPVLAPWGQIARDLREATAELYAHVTPTSERLIWRLLGWYTKGRPLPHCARRECGGAVDQKSGKCERCGSEQRLAPGLDSLQGLDRADKGEVRLRPEFAAYLTAAFLGGDETVKGKKLALERPRSAAECLELIRLEIASGNLPGPAPSYYQVARFVREVLPRLLRDYGRSGEKRAFARRGPYIVRSHAHLQVNDVRYWDFRRLNVRTWLTADGKLYRPFLCTGMDGASRDVVFRFDLYPSSQLFKSTLRAALLKWGIAREEWMDNGKEFTCEEVTGSRTLHTWTARFEVDDECASIFDKLGSAPHYCLIQNPTGKALLERFFQTFDRFERTLPGWTGEKADKRPQRLKEEERQHMEFCAGARVGTPLLRFEDLARLLCEVIEYRYRHRKHRGEGMYGRTPAQAQAAFAGERKIPRPEELDILLWHRRLRTARGDKVSFVYNGRTLIFRSEHLLALPDDGAVEIHVDPVNADRAVAFAGGRVIVLEPVNPTGGQSGFEVREEIRRKRKLEKAIREATYAGGQLAPVGSPARVLAMAKAQAEANNAALDAERKDSRTEFSIPAYSQAAHLLREPQTERLKGARTETAGDVARRMLDLEEEHVFTSQTEYEQWLSQHKPAK